jgi:HAD superfamily hydrolase (TIGR01549 family)
MSRPEPAVRVPIFDLDGTLVDSDEALVAPFVALGIERDEITFGHVLAEECERLGLDVDDYLARYDVDRAMPFAGVDDLVQRLTTWAVCSNKHPRPGAHELRRLGWTPQVAMFSDAFEGPKRLGPVLDALGLGPDDVVFVGDTAHDRVVAAELGVPFGLAAWNPRARSQPGDVVLDAPLDVLAFCRSAVTA